MIGDTSPVFSPTAMDRAAYEAYVKEAGGVSIALGKIGYETYVKKAGGVSLVSGEPLPAWSCLSLEIRKCWEASGNAMSEMARFYLSTGM
jgi:hypothetical protein